MNLYFPRNILIGLIAALPVAGDPVLAQSLYMDVNGATAGFGDYKPSQAWFTTGGTSIWTSSAAGTAGTDTYENMGGANSSNVVFDLNDITGLSSSNTPVSLMQNTTVNSLTIHNGRAKVTFGGAVAGTTLSIGTLNITGTTTTNDPFSIGSNLALTGNITVNGFANRFVRLGNYNGTVTLNSGLLTDTNSTTDVHFVGGAVQSNTGGISVGSISGNGTLLATFGGGYIVTQDVNGAFNGAIIGAGSGAAASGLTKRGNAILTLTGAAKTYTNTTNIDNGALIVNTSLAASNGVVVKPAARLGGSGGTVTGVTVQSGGQLGGTGMIDLLNTGALSLQGTASFDLEFNITDASTATSDLYNTTGGFSLDLNNTVTLSLSNLGSNILLNNGLVLSLVDYSGVWNGGMFTFASTVLNDDDQFSFGANTFQISYNGVSGSDTSVILQAVPEPGISVLLLIGLTTASFFHRRRFV